MAPVPSSGLRGLAKSGMKLRRAVTEAGESGGQLDAGALGHVGEPPALAAESAEHGDPPPAPVPARRREERERVEHLVQALDLDDAPLPERASTISGVPASDPVWASVASRAFSDRPTLSATIGLPRSRAWAAT